MDGVQKKRYLIHNLPLRTMANHTVLPRQTGDGTTLLYRFSEQGVFLIATIDRHHQKKRLDSNRPVLLFPARPGTRWHDTTTTFLLEKTGPPQRTLFRIQERLTLEHRIVADNITVKVPAGTFTGCLRIDAHGRVNADVGNYVGKVRITIEQSQWYAPNTGLVKAVRREQTDSPALDHGEYEMVLVRYR